MFKRKDVLVPGHQKGKVGFYWYGTLQSGMNLSFCAGRIPDLGLLVPISYQGQEWIP